MKKAAAKAEPQVAAEAVAVAEPAQAETPAEEQAVVEAAEEPAAAEEGESLGGFILIAILAGLAAVFTPCVFPMIPMTVSFFIDSDASGKGGRGTGILKGAIFTGSITLIYTAIGAIVAATKSADFANVLST
ncbi:MAG: thiol:disulfide interchange protein, partial [Bacteroidales bacterium]|nr:thiol:disulfide interchange protein [Bacteroidales bacterium]